MIIISKINNHYYGFSGGNLFFSSKFSKVYEKTISIKKFGETASIPRNPLSLNTIREIKETENPSDIKSILTLLTTKYNQYKIQSTSKPEWGSALMWGLFYSFIDFYNKEYSTLTSAKNFDSACDKFLISIKKFCQDNKNKFNCNDKGMGYLPNSKYWSKESPAWYFIKNIPMFFLKYIHWTLGEKRIPSHSHLETMIYTGWRAKRHMLYVFLRVLTILSKVIIKIDLAVKPSIFCKKSHTL